MVKSDKIKLKSIRWLASPEPLVIRVRVSNYTSMRPTALLHGQKINIPLREDLYDIYQECALIETVTSDLIGRATFSGLCLVEPDLENGKTYIKGEFNNAHNLTRKNGDKYVIDATCNLKQEVEVIEPAAQDAIFMLRFIDTPIISDLRVLSATKNDKRLNIHSISLLDNRYKIRFHNTTNNPCVF
jgi:hypothetical protein